MTDSNGHDENKLIAERRRKLDALREGGNPYPNDFHRNALADELQHVYGTHENELLDKDKVEVSVAGRMMVKRVMGKASFIKLQDRSGQIQVRVERDRLPEGVYAGVGAPGRNVRIQSANLTCADSTRAGQC